MEKIIIEGLKEEVYYEKLPSGLDVYLWKNEKAHSFFASLNVKYGSIHTEFKIKNKIYKVPDGIAHFLEHINFNTKDGSVYDIFDKLGSDINAFTTFEYTSYHLTGATDIEENLNNLLDYVYTPYFKKQGINNERGIILEEAKSGLDNPGNVYFYKILENSLHNDKRRNKVIGNLDDIKKISLDDINLVYDTFYHPENMFMVVTGNIDIYATLACIKENMAKKEFKEFLNPQIVTKKEPVKMVKDYEEITGNIEIPRISINIKQSDKKMGRSPKDYIILSLILRSNFGTSSEFKNDLIDKKLVTALSYSRMAVNDNILISVDASTKYPEEVIELIKEKFHNLEISQEDFERKRRASIANLVFLYDNAEEVNMNIQDDIIYSKDHKIINDVKKIYEDLTYEEVIEKIKKINYDNMLVQIMKPKKETK